MARAKEPKYRIGAYDGDYKTRNLLPHASSGHRLQTTTDKKAEALQIAEEWLAKHPPQRTTTRDQTEPYLLISDRDGNRRALWKASGNEWVEQYNHLKTKSRRRSTNPTRLKNRLTRF